MAKKIKKLNKKPEPAKVVKKGDNWKGVKGLEIGGLVGMGASHPDLRQKIGYRFFAKTQMAEGSGVGDGCIADVMKGVEVTGEGVLVRADAIERAVGPAAASLMAEMEGRPPTLTPTTVQQSVNLALEALAQVLPAVIGMPESAPLLKQVKGWKKAVEQAEEYLSDSLKPEVLVSGDAWGENGSKQLVLGGTRLKVKVSNQPPADPALIKPEDLDPKKLELVLRENLSLDEDPLENYMASTVVYALPSPHDPSTEDAPSRYVKLVEMLTDPTWGPMLRACLKTPTYAMMPPEDA